MKVYLACAGALLLCLAGAASYNVSGAYSAAPFRRIASIQPSPCGPNGREIPLATDTLLHIDNEGVTRIFANVNGHEFKLVTDPAEVSQSENAFLIPASGTISINIAALMQPTGNCYAFTLQGPTGTSTRFIFANVRLPDQEIAYAINGLQPLPRAFDLLHSYPNPFRHRTTITYDIPENQLTGVDVLLAIYDVQGRRVRVLVDERRFPGRFTVHWDGTGRHGRPVAAGMYFCRIIAGGMQQTIPIVYVR